MAKTVFIDGSAGTTGLQIQQRLAGRSDIHVVSLAEAEKKDPTRRAEALNDADITLLCLPDAASQETVSLAKSDRVRIIDTSTAFRVDPTWVYGLPEYSPAQAARIASSARVANPGCYPTGPILMLSPLVNAGILPSDYPVSISAVSGYTGGGRQMVERFEDKDSPAYDPTPFFLYGLQLQHKHLEEMRQWAQLDKQPVFVPSVANFPQGMITQIPLDLDLLTGKPSVEGLHGILAGQYRTSELVTVSSLAQSAAATTLDAELMAGQDGLQIHVFAHEEKRQALLVAVYDNLGKGASGAAVQNLNLMLEGGA